jgi:hypothetical protein
MSDFDKWAVHVLVPTTQGLSVCPLGQLLGSEDESLDEMTSNCSIESTWTNSPDEALHLIDRVENLNETGDAHAYWATELK